MSTKERRNAERMTQAPKVRALLDQWSESLVQVLESMTDQRPEIGWRFVEGPFAEVANGEFLWWRQSFRPGNGLCAWVGAPKTTWEQAGTLTLKAAGLEKVEAGEARNTWFEILGQSLSVMARSIGAIAGHEVTCDSGDEQPPDAAVREWASVSVTFGQAAMEPLLVTLGPELVEAISAPASAPETPQSIAAQDSPPEGRRGEIPCESRTMELLMDVDLPISISFGKTQLPMKDVVKLTTGSIVELNRGVNDQVDVLVNQFLVARGEVVVVDGNYGVRIQEIVSRRERLRSLK